MDFVVFEFCSLNFDSGVCNFVFSDIIFFARIWRSGYAAVRADEARDRRGVGPKEFYSARVLTYFDRVGTVGMERDYS